MKKPKISMFKSGMTVMSGKSVALPPKTVAPVYQTPEHRKWRDAVLARAGSRCEFIDEDGQRCTKAAPQHRMFADHKHEIRDGGAIDDLGNGKCLCGSHHTAKTAASRAARRFT